MTTSEIEAANRTAVVEPAQTQPKKDATSNRTVDKRAEAVHAKKKKKRAAHKVALRRSHTGG